MKISNRCEICEDGDTIRDLRRDLTTAQLELGHAHDLLKNLIVSCPKRAGQIEGYFARYRDCYGG